MNISKTIKELSNRLDVVYPYSSSSTDNEIRNDGINYWKGKKIISAKKWNEIYEKNSIYTDNYRITLVSRKPLQYFPDDYNGSISSIGVGEELKKEAEQWNSDYYELLEFRNNPTLGRNKCHKCLLSASLDDPLFIGIEKVFARIINSQCSSDNNSATVNDRIKITYPCSVMNIFNCPFGITNNNNNKYPYTIEVLFFLGRMVFIFEQAISTTIETTRNNDIIYQVDFEENRIQEIHTNYNGEREPWGWYDDKNLEERLSKVRPISDIVIRDEYDVCNTLKDRKRLESLFQQYLESNRQKEEEEEQRDEQNEESEIDKTRTRPQEIDTAIKKQVQADQILLIENKEKIIDFILKNKDLVKPEDLKIYGPSYPCYRTKGNCNICNNISNIICINCCNHNPNKEVWLCINHWQQHAIEKHTQLIR